MDNEARKALELQFDIVVEVKKDLYLHSQVFEGSVLFFVHLDKDVFLRLERCFFGKLLILDTEGNEWPYHTLPVASP